MKLHLPSLVKLTLILVLMHLVPLVFLQPLWLTAICGTLVIARFFQTENKPISRWILWALRIGIGFCIWQIYQSFLVDAAGGAFAVMLASVKVYDLHKKNDFFFVAIYCLVTLMSDLLVESSWLFASALFINAFAVVIFLFAVQQGYWRWRSWRGPAQTALITTLKALPLIVVMYVIFPRNNADFSHAHNGFAKTGIADSLQPGSVSELTASDELVFRAHFLNNNTGAIDQQYWRGAMLDISNGLNWARHQGDTKKTDALAVTDSPDVQVDLEAGSERFLFSLENLNRVTLPANSDYHLNTRSGRIFELSEALRARAQYFLQTGSSLQEDAASADYLKVNDPPSAELKKFLARFHGKPDEIVRDLLHFFGRQGFKYSMNPPKVSGLDEFLFQTKTGFCEHYAGAMATLLRHLRVPARVIVGFQGGSKSELADYVSVRGHNAHAWVEYFDSARRHWQRVDPTMELEFAIPEQSQAPNWVPNFLIPSYLHARKITDELDARWTHFMLGHDVLHPKDELITAVAQNFWWVFALAIFAYAGVFFVRRSRRPKISLDEQIYLQLLRQLQKWNIEKSPAEGLLTLFEKVTAAQPKLAQQLEPIFSTLLQIRYGQLSLTTAEARLLRSQVHSLRQLKVS